MEGSESNGSDIGGVGLENKALDIEEGLAENGESISNETENVPNGKMNAQPAKHARFKIINHSQSTQNLDPQLEPGSGNGKIEEISSTDSEDSRKETLSVSQSGHLKRRNESDSNQHGTHHSTQGFATIGYSTTEAVPMTVFYRNEDSLSNVCKKRPTLHELHKGGKEKRVHKDKSKGSGNDSDIEVMERGIQRGGTKIGWMKGVLIPCLLNIWGVIMFLRLTWIVGQAGVAFSSIIVLLACVVTIVSSLSMSAICTNGEVKGGGAYYFISRSLGPEFGGSIGIIFSIANAVAVALYVVGFAETVRDLMLRYGTKIVDSNNDIRIVGLCALVLLFIVTLVGLEWVMYTQVFLLLILVASIISILAGSFYPNPINSREQVKAWGIFGYNATILKENLVPQYRDGNNFFSVFAIFFPAATGILAGANLSGDLKDASAAVPKGTLMAIAITSVSYLIMCWIIGSTTVRDASGIVAAVSNMSVNATCTIGTCQYGSMNDFQLLEKLSIWGPIVTTGIFAATLSSALASLVSAPKVFQAVCKDNIFPGIEFFGKGDDKNEPRRGYVLTFFIGAAFIAIGDLNVIAPIISNFFLMAYALINYAVFNVSLAKTPGWRPSFRYYNKWAALLGFLLCIGIMFFMNWWAALITVVSVAGLYKFVDYRRPDINWGSSGHAYTYLKALRFTRRLDQVGEHVKNFRVQCLVLSGPPSSRPNLVHFASHITKSFGLLVCGEVFVSDGVHLRKNTEADWLRKHKIKAFHQVAQSRTLYDGATSLMQCVGLGRLRPNTMLLGYMTKWQASTQSKIDEYFNLVHTAFDLHYGIAILRMQDGFDITEEADDEDEQFFLNQEPDWYTEDWDESQIPSEPKNDMPYSKNEEAMEQRNVSPNPEIVIAFHKKNKGTIDVWWLYDDGGLTILVPHLLSLSTHWRGCKLRIFTPASDKKIKANQIRMANLLKKFRIDFSSVVEFRGMNKPPRDESIEAFRKLRNGEHLVEDSLDKKTLRQIRLGELVKEHSHDAKLIVLTLPIPKKAVVTSLMYMSWLEVLSSDLPPVLLIRGNQTSVLTFYS